MAKVVNLEVHTHTHIEYIAFACHEFTYPSYFIIQNNENLELHTVFKIYNSVTQKYKIQEDRLETVDIFI